MWLEHSIRSLPSLSPAATGTIRKHGKSELPHCGKVTETSGLSFVADLIRQLALQLARCSNPPQELRVLRIPTELLWLPRGLLLLDQRALNCVRNKELA